MALPQLGSPLRIISALLAAALVAGAIIGIEWFAFMILAWLIDGQAGAAGWEVAILSGAVGAFCFAIGLIFPGSVVWLWLHGIGKRSYQSAAISASIGAYIASVLISASAGWIALGFGLWAVIPGAAAGLTLRALAYHSKLSPAPPA